jgi:DNA-directed RNA polymerase subunit RPC12/RpoP
MAKLEVRCDHCGKDILMDVNQTMAYGDQLVWNGSYLCSYCGSQIEVDGGEDIPEDVRNAILAQQGEWALNVTETSRIVPILKVLREALHLSLGMIAQCKERMPGIVATGTRAEMERLHLLLLAEHLESSVQRTP